MTAVVWGAAVHSRSLGAQLPFRTAPDRFHRRIEWRLPTMEFRFRLMAARLSL